MILLQIKASMTGAKLEIVVSTLVNKSDFIDSWRAEAKLEPWLIMIKANFLNFNCIYGLRNWLWKIFQSELSSEFFDFREILHKMNHDKNFQQFNMPAISKIISLS